eukprot:2661-Heterococcus_DN1.PRE.3
MALLLSTLAICANSYPCLRCCLAAANAGNTATAATARAANCYHSVLLYTHTLLVPAMLTAAAKVCALGCTPAALIVSIICSAALLSPPLCRALIKLVYVTTSGCMPAAVMSANRKRACCGSCVAAINKL